MGHYRWGRDAFGQDETKDVSSRAELSGGRSPTVNSQLYPEQRPLPHTF